MWSLSRWMSSVCLSAALLMAGPLAFLGDQREGRVSSANPTKASKAAKESPQKAAQPLYLKTAVKVSLPNPKSVLEAENFRLADGRGGWVLRIPGGRPLATPAYADGKLFFGGGYGSHEFYAVDSESGKVVWKIQTGDDGPTAAVATNGLVAFNTESCTLVVVDEKTGRVIWQEWLGDPLMSQPAIDKGVLYMAHPAATGRPTKPAQFHPRPATPGGSHRLLAADLHTGRHIWEQEIAGDVLSAPVISDGTVYFTTFDGTSYALDSADGSVLWVKKNAATSAPVVMNNQLYETRKRRDGKEVYEGLARADTKEGNSRDSELLAETKAPYLDKGQGGGVALSATELNSLDASVGFATAPPSAKLSQASETVGVSSVAGAWAYQGSRAAISKGHILDVQGNHINSVRASDGGQTWQVEVVGAPGAPNAQVFSPPAVGRDYLYLAGAGGHLVSVRQSDGQVGFSYALNAPMVFQPTLAKGHVYVGTADGRLVCLKTGSADADGWYAWGGNAQHNKVQ